MKCPACKDHLVLTTAENLPFIESCPACNGVWYSFSELQQAVTNEAPELVWMDAEHWGNVHTSERVCPCCEESLWRMKRGDVELDACLGCKGVWLDVSELTALAAVLGQEVLGMSRSQMIGALADQIKDVFTGAKPANEEAADALIVFKLLARRTFADHPAVGAAVTTLYAAEPQTEVPVK
jgi:Zn-finger nucleic acid-binding protein